MREILQHPRALGVAEMMNFPGVIAGDPDVLARMVAPHVDGHAPGVTGAALDAYVAAGISTDHEAFTAAEALEKRRRGMWVLIREASNARNLRALLAMVREHGPDYCAFCTDDREPDLLYREGHIDQMCRIAVAEGIAAEDVLVMATLHGARAHGLLDRGAIAPGYIADVVLLEDLSAFAVARAQGRAGAQVPLSGPPPAARGDTMHALAGVVRDPGRAGAGPRDRDTAGTADHRRGRRDAALARRHVVADPARDLAKIAVIERHHATGRVGLGLVRGFGLRAGAFASTVAHDAHNLVVVGVSDADMALCAERAQALGGGLVVARDGVVRGELALPVAGLLSDAPLEVRSPRDWNECRTCLPSRACSDRRAVHDALVPRAVGDPVAEDHRPRALVDVRTRSASCRWSSPPRPRPRPRAKRAAPAARVTPPQASDAAGAPASPSARIALDRDAFVARFGALYESSPWVAETAWRADGFAGADQPRRTARRDVRLSAARAPAGAATASTPISASA